jgi:hypothetical protein
MTLPEVGGRYGRYQINRLIGRGGTGVVYEAADTMLRRLVALKVFLPGLNLDQDFQARLAREASMLARIRSGNVVTILEHGVIDGSAYVATDFFPDGDLGTWLRTYGAMPREQALRLVSQVCGAVVDAHAAGVEHRGLKPSNILLRSEPGGPVPYLSDFGLATGAASELSDQSALGRMLAACLTGVVGAPLSSTGTGPTSDSEVDRVIQRALSVDPATRFADVAALKAEVDRIAGIGDEPGETPVAAPDPEPVLATSDEPPARPEPTLFRSQDLAEPERNPPPPPPTTAAPLPPSSPGTWPMAWPALPTEPERHRRWWPAALAALVLLLVIGGVAFAVTRGGHDAQPQAAAPSASATPTPSETPTPVVLPTPSAAPSSVAASTPPPRPKPTIGRLTRSSAACTGTVGDYQKWQYALTGFKPGATLHPQLAIRSDHGNGETTGKPVSVSRRGTGTGDFCVPVGTHGTVTITVAGTSAKRRIG